MEFERQKLIKEFIAELPSQPPGDGAETGEEAKPPVDGDTPAVFVDYR